LNRTGDTTGFVFVDKEAGWTSHDVVAQVRRLFGQRRVGHSGTLDPDATGLLVVGLGRATRLLRFLSASAKTYTGEIVLGRATDTLDASGVSVGEWEMSAVTLAEVRLAAKALSGDIDQVPPMVSALKVGGRTLHSLARQGIEVPREPRPVHVARFEVSKSLQPGVFSIEVRCSSGTYVRVLADDVGKALGGGAYLRNLRRTEVGSITVAEATALASLSPADLTDPATALRDLTRATADAEMTRMISRGLPLDRVSVGADGEGPFAVVDGDGRLLAVYEATETDRIRPAVVLIAH